MAVLVGDPVLCIPTRVGWVLFAEVPEAPEIVASSGGASVQSSEIPEVRGCPIWGRGRLQAMPSSLLPYPHGGTPCAQGSLCLQIARCVSRNSFPPPNITWHKNGEQLQPEENSELDEDGDDARLPGRGAGALSRLWPSKGALCSQGSPPLSHALGLFPWAVSSACVPRSGEDAVDADTRVERAVHGEQHPLCPRHPRGPALPVPLLRALPAAGPAAHG